MKTILTSSNKKIHIFDDMYTLDHRIHMKVYAQNSVYSTCGKSHKDLWETEGSRFLVSHYNEQDIKEIGLYDNPRGELNDMIQLIQGREIVRCWMLFSDLSTRIFYHADGDRNDDNLSVLYYVNTEWKDSWGGETIFANDFGEAEIAVSYKPGRIVVFDSSIPHKAGCISSDAPFRFTMNTVWRKK